MSETITPSASGVDRQAAEMEARVVLTQPSAFYFLQDWDRALERACDVSRRAGVADHVVDQVRVELDAMAAATGRGPDWVVREARRRLYRLVCQIV